MHSPRVSHRLVDFYTVDPETGDWKIGEDQEHHSTAVPKTINQVHARIARIVQRAADVLENRNDVSKRLGEMEAELLLQQKKFGEFEKKVLIGIRSENKDEAKGLISTAHALETVGDASKCLNVDYDLKSRDRRYSGSWKNSLTTIHSRPDNIAVTRLIGECSLFLEKTHGTLQMVEKCWKDFLRLEHAIDKDDVLQTLRNINGSFAECREDARLNSLYNAFFHLDDATKGLILAKNASVVKIDGIVATDKLIQAIQKMMCRAADHYRKSEESLVVARAFQKIQEFRAQCHGSGSGTVDLHYLLPNVDDLGIEVLQEVRIELETAPSPKASPEICFRKMGELHANISKKRFEIQALKFLKPHFDEHLSQLADKTIALLKDVHKGFIDAHGDLEVREEDQELLLEEMNVRELELAARLLEKKLLKTPPGAEFFDLSKDLHGVNQQIAARYAELNPEILEKCMDVMGSEPFLHFISYCQQLMGALAEENGDKEMNPEELQKVGAATGKTAAIKTYVQAIKEILSPLGTFLGNTLHALVLEMLINTPANNVEGRKKLLLGYFLSESALQAFESETTLRNSVLLKK